ncbi:MAG: ribosome silencing factor [Candidatus Omnitrophica bacterium]|jgi:ribosome-associated protein|nr:ribosome silencing factor [Candidatus Omnitrophota bacterium]
MPASSGIGDYFIITSTTSMRQAHAIAEAIFSDLKKDGLRPLAPVLSSDQSGWLVLDYSSIVVHVFYEPVREFYALERLWANAKKLRVPRKI